MIIKDFLSCFKLFVFLKHLNDNANKESKYRNSFGLPVQLSTSCLIKAGLNDIRPVAAMNRDRTVSTSAKDGGYLVTQSTIVVTHCIKSKQRQLKSLKTV